MSLLLILALPFAGSLCAALLPANARNAEAWLAGLVALATTLLVASLYPQIAAGEVIRVQIPWAPALGLQFALRMDGYAWLFSFIVSGMATLVVLYARYYMSPKDPVPRFFSFFQAFMAAMLGVVLSGNLIQLVMFWEMTSLASFMLIAYWHHRADARRGARMALTVTGAGGLCLLGGVLLLGHIVGSYDMDVVLRSGDLVRADPWYPAALVLVALGALTKSAQFPFQFWLPNAMAAPTPVSAYLHSATMVKAGVFLLARFWPLLAGTDEWFWLIGGAGLCTLVLGAYAAIFQQDMKGVLAYSTISHLGLITLLLGLNSPLALVAAVFHMVNHAIFKASLFMAAGIVDHETGTHDLSRLSGLYSAMPLTATMAMVAAASMAGVPLLNGFLSKEMFFAETTFITGDHVLEYGLPLMATIAGAFSVTYSLRFILQVFFGPPSTDLPRAPHEPPRWMLFPSALLVLLCLVIGVAPGLTVGPVLDIAAHSILGPDMPQFSLAVWHGFNLPLVMSLVAMTAGVLLYLGLRAQQAAHPGRVPFIYRLDGRRTFEFLFEGSAVVARWVLRRVSSPRLQVQMLIIISVTLLAAWLPLRLHAWLDGQGPRTPADPTFLLLWLAGGACAVGAAYQAKYHRLASLTLSGGAGLVTCLTFVWFSAPDLALTQLAVEVVTVVLLLLGLRWLPRRIVGEGEDVRPDVKARLRRARDLGLAALAGISMSAIAYAMLTRPLGETISSFFVEEALPEGGGTNVVNVILVDFRGFDTLGEITVLGIVALTVYALLRRFRPAQESIEMPRQQREQDGLTMGELPPSPDVKSPLPQGAMRIPAVLVRLLLPIAVLVSVYLLLRGHNLPGGGFVGGLVMATSVILQYMVGGVYWVESRSRLNPQHWVGLGLLAAGAAAMSAWLALRPFLSALAWDIHVPLIGKIHLSSVLLFDLGVYMLVVGATVLVLVALAHQSLRAQRKLVAEAQQADAEAQAATAVKGA
ncbi:monovalent cation/H+ antiporter subunit A [Bordetella holmesii]|uniref:NADH-Ubiquinone/plastoquinone (Complex I), various chains family protein n=5 Tax=Bordetella holmesii TaxID=35814 RepID=A0ABP3BJ96_9BORD|nr:monovalent cation/H+ antiporter subunit A [Bordetella holmesii]AHV94322.1 NADH-Ubiquinone/plastoquinone (complex I), various chains family protein [Bordetella holmesii ATCC 51541]AMD47020.1 cation:proton antiporter [Bordetella holmesii H558]AMD47600.1 cation:proton antiporter [Bordetella holmesii F627]AOB35919.1 monovalent cation/H+ antiporter subunit A [Bordetella holmesii]AUL23233.1 monovalent cation/H+ antiporter subunit A [Bordetella holmesii]